MKIRYCSRCKKNIAVVFVTKIENGKTVSEGLCLKCARQMGIRQVEDVMQNMGITDEDLDNLEEMAQQSAEALGVPNEPESPENPSEEPNPPDHVQRLHADRSRGT